MSESLHQLRKVESFLVQLLKIDPIAKIARDEVQFRDFLKLSWKKMGKRVASEVSKMVEAGKGEDEVEVFTRDKFQRWVEEVRPIIMEMVDSIYRLAKQASWDHATGRRKAPLTYSGKSSVKKAVVIEPEIDATFSLLDEQTIEKIGEQQMLWIGNMYGGKISESVRESVRQSVLEGGADRRKSGQVAREKIGESFSGLTIPSGRVLNVEQYFNGLAAHVATTTRSAAHLAAFSNLGITHYEIANPEDEKTCPVCSYMVGKTFEVRHAVGLMQNEFAATSSDEMKSIHPYLRQRTIDEIKASSIGLPQSETDMLAAQGHSVPPFHFLCRCAIVTAD